MINELSYYSMNAIEIKSIYLVKFIYTFGKKDANIQINSNLLN